MANKFNQKWMDRIFTTTNVDIPKFPSRRVKSDLAFPFVLHTGFVNVTESGNTFSGEVTNYGQFERIFTGYEATLAEWENSKETKYTKLNVGGEIRKNFQSGFALDIWIDEEDLEDNISSLNEETNFLTERVITTYDAFTKKEIKEQDLIKFYIIPSRSQNVWFHIDKVTRYNDPKTNEFLYSKITFASVNNRIENTGLAVNQYIQKSAPGEGYAFPKLVDTFKAIEFKDAFLDNRVFELESDIPSALEDGTIIFVNNYKNNFGYSKLEANGGTFTFIANERGFIIDENLLNNRPITSFQIEIQGKGVLSDVYFYGRPLDNIANSQNEKVIRPRQLLLNEAQQYDVSQKDPTDPFARNTAYRLITKSNLTVESWYKSWKEQRQTATNPAAQKQYMGALEVFYGKANSVVNVNPFLRLVGDIVTLGFAEMLWPTTYEYKKVDRGDVKDFELQNISGNPATLDIPRLFMNNYLKNKIAPRLPLSYKESIPYNLTDVPLIGGFLNKVTLGLVRGWRDTKDLGGRNFNISGLIPTDLLDFYQNALFAPQKQPGTDDAYSSIPLDDLQSESSPDTLSKTDFKTILNYTLTDTFVDIDANGNPFGLSNTKDFGYVNNAGDFIAQWDFNQSVPTKNTDDKVKGYAIDIFGFHILGDGDVKITFYSGNNAVYTTKVKTLSNLTKSIRDWNSNYKLSNWNAPAGIGNVEPQNTYYVPQASDFTIPKASAEDPRLANIRAGVAIPQYVKDQNGDNLLDANGNFIPERDSNGNVIFEQKPDAITGTGKAAEVKAYSETTLSTITERNIVINPEKIYSENTGDGGKVIPTGQRYKKNIKDILEDYGYKDDEIQRYSTITLSLQTYIRGDSGGSTAGNIFSFGIAATESSDTSEVKEVKYDIFRNAQGSYDLRLSQNYTGININLKNDWSGGEADLSTDNLGNIELSVKKNDSDTRIHETWIKMTNVKVEI